MPNLIKNFADEIRKAKELGEFPLIVLTPHKTSTSAHFHPDVIVYALKQHGGLEIEKDYELLCNENETSTFDYNGFKFKEFTPARKFTYVGETGKKIKVLNNKATKIKKEITGLQKLAKETGTGVVITQQPVKEGTCLFSLTLIAPKKVAEKSSVA